MKLFLTSAGIRTQELADALAELVGKDLTSINVAIVNEASAVELGDKSWLLDELGDLRKYIGGDIDFVDLLALSLDEIKERMETADIIYVVGGNPDYLLYLYKKVGFDKLLQDTLLNVGSSAGSMVLGRRGSTKEYQEFYGEDRNFGTNDYLGVIDFVIKPHFESLSLPKNRQNILRKSSIAEQQTIYAIRDDQAIVVVNNTIRFAGGDVFKLEKL